MIIKEKVLGITLFLLFMAVGWITGISPLKTSLKTSQEASFSIKKMLEDGPVLNMSNDYVSSNQYKIDVLHYDLELDLYPKEKMLKGIAEITGVILQPELDKIDLNFYDNLKIKELTLNNLSARFKNKGTRLSVYLDSARIDTFKLKVVYEGTPKRAGLSAFVFGEINGQSAVYNLNEPSYASTWFPCNDIPSDKVLLDIKITNDSSQVSVSNGILVSREVNNDRMTYHWKTYYPISTYLICLYSSKYIEFEDKYISADGDTMPIKYYTFPNHLDDAKIDFKDTPKMIAFFSKTFGEYPFIKEKYGVAEFLWQMGAMEHQTITGIGSNFVGGKNFFEDVYVHELAHHWWGNAVGPASWKDIWLNEGFATYSEALYIESKSGKEALQSTMLSKFSDEFSNTLYDPGKNLFSPTVYDKGAWVLHMLRWEVGDSIFFEILRTYFEKYKYKNASTSDFIRVCENLSKRDLTKFFDQWVFTGKENIQLDYKWVIKKEPDGKNLIVLNLSQHQENYSPFEFKLEVKLEYDGDKSYTKIFNINEKEMTIEILVDEPPNQLILDPNNWLLANIKDRNSYEE
jgi:aminopeptidase N